MFSRNFFLENFVESVLNRNCFRFQRTNTMLIANKPSNTDTENTSDKTNNSFHCMTDSLTVFQFLQKRFYEAAGVGGPEVEAECTPKAVKSEAEIASQDAAPVGCAAKT